MSAILRILAGLVLILSSLPAHAKMACGVKPCQMACCLKAEKPAPATCCKTEIQVICDHAAASDRCEKCKCTVSSLPSQTLVPVTSAISIPCITLALAADLEVPDFVFSVCQPGIIGVDSGPPITRHRDIDRSRAPPALQ